MHVFFSGIGGTGIGPIALIAKQAGHNVSGSDKQDSQYITYLRQQGLDDIHIGQSREQISHTHELHPIDWYVYSSAVPLENPNAPEIAFCREQGIQMSKRDDFLNFILEDKHLKLIAIAGTHGKTTTTAMIIWLFRQLGVPLGYSVGAKISFGDMGQLEKNSEFFVYECDEFDRNFLSFRPHLSLITGVSWDHHEIYPTREDYQQAFREFVGQSETTVMWQEDFDYLELAWKDSNFMVQESSNPLIEDIALPGLYNRLDGWLAIRAVSHLTSQPIDKLIKIMNDFPGLQRRMEEIVPGLYSDYAHTPDKIRGAMSVALEMAQEKKQKVIVIYEPLTNRRQHYIRDDYSNCFEGASRVYWLPSYLARENPDQPVLTPEELVSHLDDPSIAEPAQRDGHLKAAIENHLGSGDMVVGMAGGGGSSLDEWLRSNFKK